MSDLERAAAALHRDRRGRDERAGAGLRPARRRRSPAATAADSSYMERLRRRGSTRRSATTPPTCRRGPRSSSRPRSARTTRSWRWPASAASSRSTAAQLLAELCAEKRLIAIAGTHGKTTTTAMAAWALRAIGADPAFFVGGEVPGLGPDGEHRQRRLGRGGVGRRRGRRERRQLPAPAPRGRGRHQRRDGPPLALGLAGRAARGLPQLRRPGAGAGRARRTRRWAGCGRAAARMRPLRRRGSRARRSCSLAVPGEHNLRNARAALAAIELAGLDVAAAAEALAGFRRRPPPPRAEGLARAGPYI